MVLTPISFYINRNSIGNIVSMTTVAFTFPGIFLLVPISGWVGLEAQVHIIFFNFARLHIEPKTRWCLLIWQTTVHLITLLTPLRRSRNKSHLETTPRNLKPQVSSFRSRTRTFPAIPSPTTTTPYIL